MYFFFGNVFPRGMHAFIKLKTLSEAMQSHLKKMTIWQRSHKPFICRSYDSARNCRILSDGIANDIPAVTFSVLMPMTSPSLKQLRRRMLQCTEGPQQRPPLNSLLGFSPEISLSDTCDAVRVSVFNINLDPPVTEE